jgi:hypothetical protein
LSLSAAPRPNSFAVSSRSSVMSALNPNDVLADLFEEMLVQNSEELAAAVIQRLLDAGFKIVLIDD